MKFLKRAAIALMLPILFLACKKESGDAPANAPIDGIFSGKYGFGNDVPGSNYTLQLKPDLTIEELGQSSGAPTGRGKWALSGNSFTASYKMLYAPYSDYFVIGTYDASTNTITGTWGYEHGGKDGGKFTVTRK